MFTHRHTQTHAGHTKKKQSGTSNRVCPAQEKKVESDAAENEKDASTEKESSKDGGAGGDAAAAESASSPIAASSPVAADKTAETTVTSDSDAGNKTLENGSTADETLNDSKAAAEDSNKKPKKVKKKWSFRSISFSKKDKQKPAKKEKDGEEKVNGDCEKVPEEVSGFLFFFLFCVFFL